MKTQTRLLANDLVNMWDIADRALTRNASDLTNEETKVLAEVCTDVLTKVRPIIERLTCDPHHPAD